MASGQPRDRTKWTGRDLFRAEFLHGPSESVLTNILPARWKGDVPSCGEKPLQSRSTRSGSPRRPAGPGSWSLSPATRPAQSQPETQRRPEGLRLRVGYLLESEASCGRTPEGGRPNALAPRCKPWRSWDGRSLGRAAGCARDIAPCYLSPPCQGQGHRQAPVTPRDRTPLLPHRCANDGAHVRRSALVTHSVLNQMLAKQNQQRQLCELASR